MGKGRANCSQLKGATEETIKAVSRTRFHSGFSARVVIAHPRCVSYPLTLSFLVTLIFHLSISIMAAAILGIFASTYGIAATTYGLVNVQESEFQNGGDKRSALKIHLGLDINGLSNAGGDLPDTRLFNVGGEFLGMVADPGNVSFSSRYGSLAAHESLKTFNI